MLLKGSTEFSFVFAYLFTLRLAGNFLWKMVVTVLDEQLGSAEILLMDSFHSANSTLLKSTP